MTAIRVRKFTIKALCEEIASLADVALQVVLTKNHKRYFESYLSGVGQRPADRPKTLVVEGQYVDRDYLEDFSAYYARCFKTYRRFCGRIHFFSLDFAEKDFFRCIEGAGGPVTPEILAERYLGFVVVKPLPQTVIGRTCLATYDHDRGRRFFPITRRYTAHLAGLELAVDSVAFQEQDTVAAACATSALWSAFHITGDRFGHEIPSPVKITQWANEQFPLATRTLPSTGLTLEQMAGPVRRLGLEPDVVGVAKDRTAYFVQTTVYAYLRGRVPPILVGDIYDTTQTPPRKVGYHAMTATGFSLGAKHCVPLEYDDKDPKTLLRCTRIDKLYVHDDQIGPFARIELDAVPTEIEFSGQKRNLHLWTTSSLDRNGEEGHIKFLPVDVLLPLYPKIRISIHDVESRLIDLDLALEALRKESALSFAERIEWDLYLDYSTSLKKEIRDAASGLPAVEKRELLTAAMPRFIWRATALVAGVNAFEFVFDATDINRGRPFFRSIVFDQSVADEIREAVKIYQDDIEGGFGKAALTTLQSI